MYWEYCYCIRSVESDKYHNQGTSMPRYVPMHKNRFTTLQHILDEIVGYNEYISTCCA